MSDEIPKNDADSTDPVEQTQPGPAAESIESEQSPSLDFPVVGIGASAGGLEACIEFFDAMPSNSGIAFVVVLHLAAERESMIADIFSKHTEMPVTQAEEGTEVEPNHVFVIPPGRALTIKDGHLVLGKLREASISRPIDDFFRSLAAEQRERAICIVMSGMGSDGSAGVGEIKAVGGVAIAQEPGSAAYPSMPQHLLESGNADYVRRPEEMPDVLVRYAAQPYVQGARNISIRRDERQLNEIIRLLHARTRRDYSGYKKPTLIRRIKRRMGLNDIRSFENYSKFLRQNTAEATSLSDDLVIHVTGFFRDPEAWEALREKAISPLINSREAGESVRCWVTACSSGEEAYTLAVLLHETAELAGKQLDIKVFATDLAERTLTIARSGVYPIGIDTDISLQRLERYFDREESIYRVKKELREIVIFAPQNVLQDPPFSRLDICTCRNLFIYLVPEIQDRVLSLLHFGLHAGGVLFLGNSETVSTFEDLFEPIDKRARIYRRRGLTRPGAIDFTRQSGLFSNESERATMRSAAQGSVTQISDRVLLDQLAPVSVTVDGNFNVVHFHGDTTPYLIHPSGSPTRELFALTRESLQGTLRSALNQAANKGSAVSVRDGVIDTADGKRRIEVKVTPLENNLAPNHHLISFLQHPELDLSQSNPPLNADPTQVGAENQHLREELASAEERLQASREEMKSSQEEAMSINEELQSTNEELETSKEELQSLNEELTTLNAQLQDRMQEHQSTSNDLTSLLSSTNIAVVFLDAQLRIRRFTPSIEDLLHLIPGDVGRPLSDLAREFTDPELVEDCKNVLNKLAPLEKELKSNSGRVYLRRVQPYITDKKQIAGVVLTFVDIHDRKKAEEAFLAIENRFRLVIDGALDFAMLLTDEQGTIVTWNIGAERLLGYSAAEAIGKSASIIYPAEGGVELLKRQMEQAAVHGRAIDDSWHVRKSGTRLWGSGILTAVRDDKGELTGFVKVLRDDTSRESLLLEQSARREAETANRHKEQFLSTVSHELRTPLAAILLWARMLNQGTLGDDEKREAAAVIETCAEAQQQLLDDLIETSRLRSGKVRLEPTPTDLVALIRRTIEASLPIAKEKGILLDTDMPDEFESMVVDAARLTQVLNNLLNNAFKFTPAGGRIEVRLRLHEGRAQIQVSDTGEGIDPAFLPQLFTPFSQADPARNRWRGGLGLGLAICRELVELHGGTINADSVGTSHGTTFTVELPAHVADPVKRNDATDLVEDKPNLDIIRNVRVLLVEDDVATLNAMVKFLQKEEIIVTAASTAADAMASFELTPPDIIVSDIALPDEDGYQLLRRIRSFEAASHRSAVPAIALTAFAGSSDSHHASEAGFQLHLAKPAYPVTLLNAVARLLAEARGAT